MVKPISNMTWERCPAVWTGGKAYFYFNREHRIWVVWNRIRRAWMIQDDNGFLNGPFNTAKSAMTAAIIEAKNRVTV